MVSIRARFQRRSGPCFEQRRALVAGDAAGALEQFTPFAAVADRLGLEPKQLGVEQPDAVRFRGRQPGVRRRSRSATSLPASALAAWIM